MGKRIIDAHSHIGKDIFYPLQGDINEYTLSAGAVGVTDSIIMPVPCPLIKVESYDIKQLIWSYDETQKEFKYDFFSTSQPYIISNLITKLILDNFKSDINFYFAPLIHPILDSFEYLVRILEQNPVALKIHGVSAGIDPKNIKNKFWEIIRYYNKPLIIHTDYDSSKQLMPLTILRNSNTPLSWIELLEKNKIRAFLTHGVRLCKRSIDIVNTSDLFCVGIGPDSLISIEKNRIMSESDYLETLINSVSKSKLCFDLDYPWNVNKSVAELSSTSTDLDFNSIRRIENLCSSDEEFEQILSLNSANFFNI